MEDITIKNGVVNWRGNDYTLLSFDKLNDTQVHINFDGTITMLVGGDTTINSKICNTSDEIIEALKL